MRDVRIKRLEKWSTGGVSLGDTLVGLEDVAAVPVGLRGGEVNHDHEEPGDGHRHREGGAAVRAAVRFSGYEENPDRDVYTTGSVADFQAYACS